MKIYQVFLLFWFGCSVSSQTNGVYFQQPSVKWAIAHSYSWVIEPKTFEPNSNYRSNFESLQNQVQQQAQKQAQQQAQQIQQQMEDQARQQAQYQMQQQAVLQAQRQAAQQLQEAQHRQAAQQRYEAQQRQAAQQRQTLQEIQQRALQAENVAPGTLRRNDISNPSLNFNSYNQDLIDEIVRKVIHKTTGDSYPVQPSTKGEIEGIVREVLLEYPSHERLANRDYRTVPNTDYGSPNHNEYQYGFPQLSKIYSPRNEKYITNFPAIETEEINPQTDCSINCGNIGINDGQPIAVAMASAFHPGSSNRLTKGNMQANSFTYTSV